MSHSYSVQRALDSTTTLLFGFLILCNSAQANINQGERVKMESEPHAPQCTFRGRLYSPGEIWHANTSSPHCVMCTCLQTGKLNCTNLDCCGDDDSGRGGGGSSSGSVDLESGTFGVTEANSRGTNACCETCGRRSSAMRSSTIPTISQDERDSSSHYYDEETDDDPLVRANLEHVSCLHQGKIYRNREVFAANMSGLPIYNRSRDHCVHCVCQGGMVLCTMDPCSGFDCSKNVSGIIMKACCEKCNDPIHIFGQ
ncbi:unnamed protein product [Allacma fusca]|uniref:VWFC domain-containing protein n=1 Tax=Allacma fusca TaxID=39272 RepID=A0A8J2P7T0_9HEXA|nr:unnamed protein product [Allacma fusca]